MLDKVGKALLNDMASGRADDVTDEEGAHRGRNVISNQ
jgi:hypothetical protein